MSIDTQFEFMLAARESGRINPFELIRDLRLRKKIRRAQATEAAAVGDGGCASATIDHNTGQTTVEQ